MLGSEVGFGGKISKENVVLFGELTPYLLCGTNQMFQTRNGFLVTSGFQTAVRIDPKLFNRNLFQHLVQCQLDFFDRRNSWRVDVINTWANFCPEVVFL